MPNTREKLIECYLSSIDKCLNTKCRNCEYFSEPQKPIRRCQAAMVADDLIANGVTFAKDNNAPSKWIPASEPPKENGYYLCVVCVSAVNHRKEYRRMILFWEDNVWIEMQNCFRTRKPTHWMPLPEPPKGE